ncbi:MAG: 3-deoxy-manno-octulosonate cytidylyltransferase [Gammaproteobacteria bacterium]|nr:3-deoxy-manno-octulosonate cytidylyltransferase [Gammaproteobacteria bacterium]
MSFTVIIPARYGSVRFPGKLLQKIAGKPVIWHVSTRSLESSAQSVIVATDDKRIREAVADLPVQVCMTHPDHASGTERIAEVIGSLQLKETENLVNVQGDEPNISPRNIQQAAHNLEKERSASVATLCVPIEKSEELLNPNVVKVVMDKNHRALYFSRAPIPWDRNKFSQENKEPSLHYRHIGIYAYRAGFIRRYVAWPPCPLEQLESLEQLRILWYGEAIHVDIAMDKQEPGIDTEADLERVRDKG